MLEEGIKDNEKYMKQYVDSIQLNKSKLVELQNIIRSNNINLILDETE
jgi:hypothetical protein